MHETPGEFSPFEMESLVGKCRKVAVEKSLSQIAVPEMMEDDRPNALNTYTDLEGRLERKWPLKESIMRAQEVDWTRFRRFLCTTVS